MKLIQRNYLKDLITTIGTPDIKVITGIRRSGKSKLMESFIDYIGTHYDNANIISIDFNLLDFDDLLDYKELNKYILEHYIEGLMNFLFIDEIQMVDNFEKVINSLHAKEMFDIYLTGSNAFLLSSDLATLFTGRTVEESIYPFSYKEYLTYFNFENPIESFDGYVTNGGMSGSYLYKDERVKYDYIKGIYRTIIERDLFKRKKLKNKELLYKISDYLMDNISNITSAQNITNYMDSNGIHVNDKTVASYINALCDAYLFYKIKRYDIKGKKYLKSNDKYYLADPTFKYATLGKKDMNYGRTYENIVAIELLRRGYEVYVGILYQKEIDFVAIRKDEKIYIQVSDDISLDSTFNREVESLLKIKDSYPKYLISKTKHPESIYEGIHIVDIGEWLAK